ncbi:leucine-rich repeat-containing protein 42 [Biomphalaria glabrata]|nr:leucine-rich repeat-containing protein 42-like [Biomphalaria glabrata]
MEELPSLFHLTLKFIGSHLTLVDSLVGFPESIGQQIFHCSSKQEQFSQLGKDLQCRRKLKIFFEAYSSEGILDGLSLHGNPLFLNDVIDDCLWLFDGLVDLDLSFCNLGDNHDALLLLTSRSRLQSLSLCSNYLTDEGIRKLTIQNRMFKQKSSLVYLDLSDNKVSDKCVSHLTCLENLKVVNIFNTGISLKTINTVWSLWDSVNPCSCIQSLMKFTTSGWACDVINIWKSQYEIIRDKNVVDVAKLNVSDAVTCGFYKRKKINNRASTPRSSDVEFHFMVHNTFTCPHRQQKPETSAISTASLHFLPRSKALKSASVHAERVCSDLDIDSLLLQYSQSPPKKKDSLLQYSQSPPKKKDSLLKYSHSPPKKKDSLLFQYLKSPPKKKDSLLLQYSKLPLKKKDSLLLQLSKLPLKKKDSLLKYSHSPPKKKDSLLLQYSKSPPKKKDSLLLQYSKSPPKKKQKLSLSLNILDSYIS